MDKTVIIAEYDNRMQAEISVKLLRSFEIESRISADDLGGPGPGQSFVRGVKVIVMAEDAENVEQILSSAQNG